MASTIQIKRGTGSAAPTGLSDGELAINLDNRKLYFGSSSVSVNTFRFENLVAENYIVSSSVTNITTQELSGSTIFGNSSDDTHQFTGAITASSDISASKATFSEYKIQNNVLWDVNGVQLRLDPGGMYGAYEFGRGNMVKPFNIYGPIYTPSHITASGDISSSGDIRGDTAYFANSAGVYADKIRRFSDSGTTTKIVLNDEVIKIHAGHSSNESVNVQLNKVVITPPLTASGDISSSGVITAEHFESSDDITAAGTIQAEQLTSTDDASVAGDLVLGSSILHNGDIDTKIEFNSDRIDLNTNGAIRIRIANTGVDFANGDISSSGNMKVAGDISSSGDITANKFIGSTKHDTGSHTTPGTTGRGDIVYFGTGTTVAGAIYTLTGSGGWSIADANAGPTATGSLAIALGSVPSSSGMLLSGMVKLKQVDGAVKHGQPLWLSAANSGNGQTTTPTGNNDIARVIGYTMSGSGTNIAPTIYFNPDNTWVEVSA
tara:strand:- start:1307 stop:2779 length:1473 start_codon:yes stop_codon:yes gene_type:complete